VSARADRPRSAAPARPCPPPRLPPLDRATPIRAPIPRAAPGTPHLHTRDVSYAPPIQFAGIIRPSGSHGRTTDRADPGGVSRDARPPSDNGAGAPPLASRRRDLPRGARRAGPREVSDAPRRRRLRAPLGATPADLQGAHGQGGPRRHAAHTPREIAVRVHG